MQGSFLGYGDLEGTLARVLVLDDASSIPTDPAATPTYRVYDGGTLVTSGTLTQADTGVITGATNATPIVITSNTHKLQTGAYVKVANVGGNGAANGTFTVTRVNANTFSLDGTTGDGPYTSGGTWHVQGLYLLSLSLTSGLGFTAGRTYSVVVTWGTRSRHYSFTVI